MGLSIPETPEIGEKTTAAEAFHIGRNLLRRGDAIEAFNALQFAAKQGHVGAQWMIGRMYASGEGAAQNDLKAFEYFHEIVRNSDFVLLDESVESRQNAAYVSQALVQLGSYYREGIPGTHVKPNPQLAANPFSRAAFNYGEASAQYNLAVMYIEGNGVPQDQKRAMQLLNLAAKKGHGPSRARLGHMMFTAGKTRREREIGLTWMNLARQTAEQSGEADAKWMIDLHEQAVASASEDERSGAAGLLERFFKP
jgi:TPR repeat protein